MNSQAAPFHRGELQAQELAGMTPSGCGIRAFMPSQHQDFFRSLRFMLLATLDERGWPIATVLFGEPGFVRGLDQKTLRVAVEAYENEILPIPDAEKRVGMLGIDFATRRRNRVNGRIALRDSQGFTVTVEESFGNCPKYIVPRRLSVAPKISPSIAFAFDCLDDQARALIARSDIMFVATGTGSGLKGGNVDISHRSGSTGFVAIDADILTVPDFSGNHYFNTLGNLLLEPRAALLFIDFMNGDILQLQGRAEILWDMKSPTRLPAVERHWRLHVEQGQWRRDALPLRWQTWG